MLPLGTDGVGQGRKAFLSPHQKGRTEGRVRVTSIIGLIRICTGVGVVLAQSMFHNDTIVLTQPSKWLQRAWFYVVIRLDQTGRAARETPVGGNGEMRNGIDGRATTGGITGALTGGVIVVSYHPALSL